MLAVTAALSVSDKITDVGAIAGLASILGLAVLSLLYFGQARELKRLREWAGRAPERTAELQEQANAAAAAAAQRRTAPVAARPPGRSTAAVTAAGAAARPAGVPAPAVPAAGAPVAGAPGAPSTAAAPATPGATPAEPAADPGAAPAPGDVGGSVAMPADGAAAAPTPPADGAPSAPGQETQALPVVDPSAAALPPAVPSVVAPVPIGPPGPPTDDNPVPLRQVSAGAPRRRTAAEAPAPAASEPSGGRGRTFAVAGAVVGAILVAVLLVVLVGGGDDKPATAKRATASTSTEFVEPDTTSAGRTSATPPVDPGSVRVFVLNATQQNGLAAEVAKSLETSRFRSEGTATAAVSNETTTTVFYKPNNKRAATAVAKSLDVAAANVKPAEPAVTIQAVATAGVIVQLGADKADLATP